MILVWSTPFFSLSSSPYLFPCVFYFVVLVLFFLGAVSNDCCIAEIWNFYKKGRSPLTQKEKSALQMSISLPTYLVFPISSSHAMPTSQHIVLESDHVNRVHQLTLITQMYGVAWLDFCCTDWLACYKILQLPILPCGGRCIDI